ncbi:Mediator of RNA polymerase II transcription subunit 14 [Gaertneriomyces sp. JEL0708]|nr:Mediator of RNA polymerase II transcription subunit 14 [Gaertneriomyces sp. JEL0708]
MMSESTATTPVCVGHTSSEASLETVLPEVPTNAVSLKDLSSRLIQSSYGRILETVESLQSGSDENKKQKILDFALSEREAFARLLAAARLGKEGASIQKLFNVHGFIDRQSAAFKLAADELWNQIPKFKRFAELSAPDVVTALDVLRTGSYQGLPKVLQSIIPKQPLTLEEEKATLQSLDAAIRRRLEFTIIPDTLKQSAVIRNGHVHLQADGLYRVALTLVGRDVHLPWRIVDLELFVKSEESYAGLCNTVLPAHMEGVHGLLSRSQVILEQSQAKHSGGLASTSTALKSGNPYAILHLHEFLQNICFKMSLMILHAQALHLASTSWKDRLDIDFDLNKGALRLVHWQEEIPPPDPRSVPAGFEVPVKKHVLEFSTKTVSSHRSEVFDKWWKIVHSKKENAAIDRDLFAARMFGDACRDTTRFDIEYNIFVPDAKGRFRKTPLTNPETAEPINLELNWTCLDVNEILGEVCQLQVRFKLQQLANIIIGRPKNEGCGGILLGDITQHVYFSDDENQEPQSGKRKHAAIEASVRTQTSLSSDSVSLDIWRPLHDKLSGIKSNLDIHYRQRGRLEFRMANTSGHVTVWQNGQPATGLVSANGEIDPETVKPTLVAVEARLNYYPDEAYACVMHCRYSSLMEDIEGMAEELEFNTFRSDGPFSRAEEESWGLRLPEHRVYLQYPALRNAWIVVAAASPDEWLQLYGDEDRKALDERFNVSGNDHCVFRIWLLGTESLDSVSNPVRRTIDFVTPIGVPDVYTSQMDDYRGLTPACFLDEKNDHQSKRLRVSRQTSLGVDPDLNPNTQSDVGYFWETLDWWSFVKIEDYCKIQYTYTELADRLRAYKIPFQYVLPPSPTKIATERRHRFRPDQLPVPECRAASRGYVLRVPAKYFSAAPYAKGRITHGDLYISVERCRETVFGIRSPWTQYGRRKKREIEVSGVRIVGRCKFRHRSGLPQPEEFSLGSIEYDRDLRGVWFTYSGHHDLYKSIGDMESKMRKTAIMLSISQQFIHNKERLAKMGIRFNSFDLTSLWLKQGSTDIRFKYMPDGFDDRLWVEFLRMDGSTPKDIPIAILREFGRHATKEFSENGDIMRILQTLQSMNPVYDALARLERHRSGPEFQLETGTNPIATEVRDMNRVTLIYGNTYGLDFTVDKSGYIVITDAATTPWKPRESHITLPRSRIPYFNEVTKWLAQSAHDVKAPKRGSAIPVPFGVIFSPGLLDVISHRIDKYLDDIGTLLHFTRGASLDSTIAVELDTERLVATLESSTLKLQLSTRPGHGWALHITPSSSSTLTITPDLVQRMHRLSEWYLIKVAQLPSNENMRKYWRLLLDILQLDDTQLGDLCKLADFELKQAEQLPNAVSRMEICMKLPEASEPWLGVAGVGIGFERESKRANYVFQFTDMSTNITRQLGLRCNYQSGVIGLWRNSIHDDLTEVAELNAFLRQRLEQDWSKENIVGLLSKVSLRPIPEKKGGPGKVFPTVRQCCLCPGTFLQQV